MLSISRLSRFFITAIAVFFLATIFCSSLVLEAAADDNLSTFLFNGPEKIEFDTQNSLIYIVNRTDFITVLDARDYSLVNKIKIPKPLDLRVDNLLKKIYITGIDSLGSKLITLDLLNKDTIKSLTSEEILQKGAQFDLPLGSRPIKLLVNPKNQQLYLLDNGLEKGIMTVDLTKNKGVKNIKFDSDYVIDSIDSYQEYDASRDKIYLLPKMSDSLTIIDISQAKINVAAEERNNWLGFASDDKRGKIYAIANDQYLASIDVNSGKISSGIFLGKTPRRVFYNYSLDKIIVTSWQKDDLTIINPDSLKIEKTINLSKGSSSEFLAVNLNQKKLYIMNSGIDSVSIINTDSLEIEKTLPTSNNPAQSVIINPITQDIVMPSRWSFTNLLFIVKPNDTTLEVPAGGNPSLTNFLDLVWKTFAHKNKGTIFVLNNIGKFSKVTALDPVAHKTLWTAPVGLNPRDLIIDYQRGQLYVVGSDSDLVSVIKEESGKVIKEITVGDKPTAIVANNNGTKVYTANLIDDTVSVIDPETYNVTATIKVGRTPKELFYDNKEELLYVWNAGDQSVTVINRDNQVIGTANLPTDALGTKVFMVGSSNLKKVYLVEAVGVIYSVFEDGGDFKTKLIRSEKDKRISDVILNEKNNKLYLADRKQKKIDVLDLNQDLINNSIDLKTWGEPVYLLGNDDNIFAMVKGGYIGQVNLQSDALDYMTYLNGEAKSNYFNWFFDFANNFDGFGIGGVYSQKDSMIYFPMLPPNPGGLAVFDVSAGSLSDILTYENMQKIKFNEANPNIAITFWQKLSLKFKIIIALVLLFLLSVILIFLRRRARNQTPTDSII